MWPTMNADVLAHIGVFAGIDERRALGFLPNRLPKDGRYAMLEQALQRRDTFRGRNGNSFVQLFKVRDLTYSVAFYQTSGVTIYDLRRDQQYKWQTEIRRSGFMKTAFCAFGHVRGISTYVVQEQYVRVCGRWTRSEQQVP
jgi:hypothetical protein